MTAITWNILSSTRMKRNWKNTSRFPPLKEVIMIFGFLCLCFRAANALSSVVAIKPGDRVMAILPRIPEFFLMQVACLRTGINFPRPSIEASPLVAVHRLKYKYTLSKRPTTEIFFFLLGKPWILGNRFLVTIRIIFFRWTPKKFRRVCMEFSKHNWATISEAIYPEMLIFGKWVSWTLFFQNILTNPIISEISFLWRHT